MAVNSSHPLTLHSRGAGKCLHSSMIVERLGRGATTADAPMPPSVGNVILIVLDHVVGAAPGRPREKGGCKEPVPSEPRPISFTLAAALESPHCYPPWRCECKMADPLASPPAPPLPGTFLSRPVAMAMQVPFWLHLLLGLL